MGDEEEQAADPLRKHVCVRTASPPPFFEILDTPHPSAADTRAHTRTSISTPKTTKAASEVCSLKETQREGGRRAGPRGESEARNGRELAECPRDVHVRVWVCVCVWGGGDKKRRGGAGDAVDDTMRCVQRQSGGDSHRFRNLHARRPVGAQQGTPTLSLNGELQAIRTQTHTRTRRTRKRGHVKSTTRETHDERGGAEGGAKALRRCGAAQPQWGGREGVETLAPQRAASDREADVAKKVRERVKKKRQEGERDGGGGGGREKARWRFAVAEWGDRKQKRTRAHSRRRASDRPREGGRQRGGEEVIESGEVKRSERERWRGGRGRAVGAEGRTRAIKSTNQNQQNRKSKKVEKGGKRETPCCVCAGQRTI